MAPVLSTLQTTQSAHVHQAMLRLREERTEKVQRIMQKIAGRDADSQARRATDPTGNRGTKVDVVG